MKEIKHISEQLELVRAIRSNNETVLRRLYTENFDKTKIYILKNNGSMPEAKDIYQEAFIAVWRNIKNGKFRPENNTAVQGYLYRVAKNKWLDHLRSARFKKTASISPGMEFNDTDGLVDTIDRETEKKEQLAMNAFKQLGQECKSLLKSFYFERKSMSEIAMDFGIAEASARNKKYRCLEKLRSIAKAEN